MELKNFYNLDECIDRKKLTQHLKDLEEDGKIEFSIERDILKIEDIDLDESEVEELLDLFDENDVFEELDLEDDLDDDWDDDSYDDDDQW